MAGLWEFGILLIGGLFFVGAILAAIALSKPKN